MWFSSWLQKQTVVPKRRPACRRPALEVLEDRTLLSATVVGDIAGQLLIGFRSGVSQAEISRFYTTYGLSELHDLSAQPAAGSAGTTLVVAPVEQAGTLIPLLERDPRVRFAEPNRLLSIQAIPNDQKFRELWGLNNTGQSGGTADADIDAPEAWNITTGSKSVAVAILDTGVDYTHPDLAANIWTNPGEVAGNGIDDDGNGFSDDVHGWDFVNNDGNPMDDHYHGTHVAGTIGAVGNNKSGVAGVAWNVEIVALKFLSASGSGTTANAIAAVNYATMMRTRWVTSGGTMGANIRLTSNSWGGGGFSQALQDAIDASGAAGMLFVAAAGNNSGNSDVSPLYPAAYTSSNIISVAATDRKDLVASFSNWGGSSVDLAAPGVDIVSTAPGNTYRTLSGTSMATPHVAGAAALIWSQYPNLTAEQVHQRLLGGADYIGAIGANTARPTVSGGRLNVFKALENDTVAPAAVTNLAATGQTLTAVTLTWTATGDDGLAGTASYYDLRYSTSGPITEAAWATATQAASEPKPLAAGSAQTFQMTGLEPDTTYWIALKVRDNVGNEAGLSNGVQASTLAGTSFLVDDMEGGANSWTTAGATSLWHLSSRRALSPTAAWYYGRESTGNYDNGTNSGSLQRGINLVGRDSALLTFWEWRQVESYAPYDAAQVQVSQDGSTWTTLWASYYSTAGWVKRTLDLTPYAGSEVLVRFTFDTVDSSANWLEGWYIDDVSVRAAPSFPALVINHVADVEGDSGSKDAVFTVTLLDGNGPVTVGYSTADGTATAGSDYQATFGTLNFAGAGGQETQTVTVPILADLLGEGNETFFVNLSGVTGAATLVGGQGTCTIRDDEPQFAISSYAYAYEGNQGTRAMVFTVTLSTPLTETATVSYATAKDTATPGSDYVAASGTLTFAPGQTSQDIVVTILGDRRNEGDYETFFVNLSSPSPNAFLGNGQGIGEIIDDDNGGKPSAFAVAAATKAGPAQDNATGWGPLLSDALFALLAADDEAPWIGSGLSRRGRK